MEFVTKIVGEIKGAEADVEAIEKVIAARVQSIVRDFESHVSEATFDGASVKANLLADSKSPSAQPTGGVSGIPDEVAQARARAAGETPVATPGTGDGSVVTTESVATEADPDGAGETPVADDATSQS